LPSRAGGWGFRGPGWARCPEPLSTAPQMAGYSYLPAARPMFLRQLASDDARLLHEALHYTENGAERDVLAARLASLA